MNLEKHIIENVVSGRGLDEYVQSLGYSPALLSGSVLMNYGCGGSNIGKELKMRGLDVKVFDADILPDPIPTHGGNEGYDAREVYKRFGVMRRRINDHGIGQLNFPEVTNLENAFFGTEDRNFLLVGNDGNIPLKDMSVDYSQALWVLHQIPESVSEIDQKTSKRIVKKPLLKTALELMRITRKAIFIAPVWQTQIAEILHAAREQGFELVDVEVYNDLLLSHHVVSTDSDLLKKDVQGLEEIRSYPETGDDRPKSYYVYDTGKIVLARTSFLDLLRQNQ